MGEVRLAFVLIGLSPWTEYEGDMVGRADEKENSKG
jgi:hypothetical protein